MHTEFFCSVIVITKKQNLDKIVQYSYKHSLEYSHTHTLYEEYAYLIL